MIEYREIGNGAEGEGKKERERERESNVIKVMFRQSEAPTAVY